MTLENMTVDELKIRKVEIDKEQRIARDRVNELEYSLQRGAGGDEFEAKTKEASELYTKSQNIKRRIKEIEDDERLNGHKRQLPQKPKKFLTHEHYFKKKAELEAREAEFKEDFEQTDKRYKEISEQYDHAVLNSTDKQINTLYDDMQKTKKARDVAKSKLDSLQNNTKQRVLDDTAMEVMLSRVNIATHSRANRPIYWNDTRKRSAF